MVWKADAEKGPESQKVRWDLVPYTRGRGLDVGCGPVKPFQHFISVDVKDFDVGGMKIKPDIISNAEDLWFAQSQSMDFVFSSYLLQELEDYKKALKEMWRVIKPWGYLILYLPHKEFYKGEKSLDPKDIVEAMKELKGWNLIVSEDRNEGDEYSFFQVYFKLKSDKQLYSHLEPKPKKTACLVRYGAFGDLMQASSVIAGLKAEGYHVTVQSSPPGSDVIRHDPNIDILQLQDKDQVPNHELGAYWKHCQKKYDKFINLSESVEGQWLAMHDRMTSKWPKNLRHKMMNGNYVEFQNELAELKTIHPIKFYATQEEKDWAKKERSKMSEFVILWSLAGSSVHKTWPYLDQIIARALLRSDRVNFVLVGGPECEMLEAGWENEKRVIRTCGKWSIRQSLAFLYEADLVIGPETGVLNAAANMDVPKIIFLSHSTVENLTRDWKNTVSLYARNTPCYPCHMLHIGWDMCKKDMEKGVAICQSDISADECWEHVNRFMTDKLLKAA